MLLLPLSIAFAIPGDPRAAMTPVSGSIVLSRDALTVQTKESFEWIYAVGEEGLSEDDILLIHDPIFHGMRWSKWGELTPYSDKCTPQTDSGISASYGLISAYAARSGEPVDDVELLVERSNCTVIFNKKTETTIASCNASIHEKGRTTITVLSGDLEDGDTVHVVHGDVDTCISECEADGGKDCEVSCEDCGFEAPDRSFPAVWWEADECLNGEICTPLDAVAFSVESQAVLEELLVTAPSQLTIGESFDLKASLLDRFGNPISALPTTITVTVTDGVSADSTEHTFTEPDGGWHDFSMSISEPGIYRITVTTDDEKKIAGTSNPIEVTEAAPDYRIYWGDIHTHHGYTWVDEGQYRDFNHDYGRDIVGLDVVAESTKAEGIELDAKELWQELQLGCEGYSEDGEYLVLLGFEWIGDDAARASECWEKTGGSENDRRMACSAGHHNIYYDGCDGDLASQDITLIDGLDGPQGLWTWLDTFRASSGLDAVSIPHAMLDTAYTYDVFYGEHNADGNVEPGYPGTQTLVEIYSEWGDTSSDPEAIGSLQEMMTLGNRTGWIGGSDNHDGWMGNPYTTQGDFGDNKPRSGIGAFLAPALTRGDIFTAMKARTTYATTGHRPIMHFSITDNDEVLLQQGSELVAQSPVLHWAYHGTDVLKSIRVKTLVVGGQFLEPVSIYQNLEAGLDTEGTIDLVAEKAWNGSGNVLFWIEALQDDGEKTWSSPIWLTTDCTRLDLGAQDPLDLCDDGPKDTDEPKDSADPTDTGDTGGDPQLRCGGCSQGSAGAALLLIGFFGLRRRVRRSGPEAR
ncbi:MAG: hypothetical protein ACI8RZ_003755 [Myxococcota bacterium]|jgi:hypothetical protein